MIVLAIFLAVVNQVFSLLDPQIFRIIVDKYASHIGTMPRAEFIRGVGLLILGFVGVAMVSRIAKNFQDYYINVVSQSVGASMYADGIAHSMRLPYRAFEDQQSGAVLQQLQKGAHGQPRHDRPVHQHDLRLLPHPPARAGLLLLRALVHRGGSPDPGAHPRSAAVHPRAAGSSRCRRGSSGRPTRWPAPPRRACATSS